MLTVELLPHGPFHPRPPFKPLASVAPAAALEKNRIPEQMSRVVPLSIIVGALAFLVAPASAQVTPKSTTHTSVGGMQVMMPECSAMMREFMADPIVQKRMMAIMQKHMMQHSGQGSMMMMPAMAGAKAMQSGSAGRDSSAHESHHSAEPAATATAAAVPSPTPSP